jgi:multidrug efflux pump subunit AcrA (membrane-fusion protein)
MATLTLDEFPSQTFHGRIARTSQSIDMASRTLNTEIDVDNPTGQLLPGAYVHVHLKLPTQTRSLTIPANTLLLRSEGLRVGVIRDGRAQLFPITIGVDYGDAVQVTSGLKLMDQLIANPSDYQGAGRRLGRIPATSGQIHALTCPVRTAPPGNRYMPGGSALRYS